MEVIEQIKAAHVVAIVRGNFVGMYRQMADSLLEGGIRIIEITLNSPGAVDAIKLLADEYSDRMLIGAGTVLNPLQVEQVADAGAKFVVSPSVLPTVIHATLAHHMETIPGTQTATEIIQAHEAGARLLKWFPAVSPDLLKALRGPFDFLDFMPTGGITEANARAYLDAGAVAVGISGGLVSADFDSSARAILDLTNRAHRVVDIVQGRPVAKFA